MNYEQSKNKRDYRVLKHMRGQSIGKAIKRLEMAENAFKERKMINEQRLFNLGQFIECKYLLEEIER